jgi:hypothetical protein
LLFFVPGTKIIMLTTIAHYHHRHRALQSTKYTDGVHKVLNTKQSD